MKYTLVALALTATQAAADNTTEYHLSICKTGAYVLDEAFGLQNRGASDQQIANYLQGFLGGHQNMPQMFYVIIKSGEGASKEDQQGAVLAFLNGCIGEAG